MRIKLKNSVLNFDTILLSFVREATLDSALLIFSTCILVSYVFDIRESLSNCTLFSMRAQIISRDRQT